MFRRALAPLAVATAVVGAGVAPGSPASAVTCCGDLVITYRSDLPASAPYLVEIYGRTSGRYYSPADYRAEVRLWGEDTFSDDLLKGPMAPLAFNGTEVYVEFAVSGSTLDEDWRDRDEIYAGIRIVSRSTGKVMEGIETYRVYAWY
jgi:hypothetical protein